VAVTGAAGLIDGTADYVLAVPSEVAAHVQEVHLMLLHVWCIHVDAEFGQIQAQTKAERDLTNARQADAG
jgi:hypothetical protein